MNEEVRGKSLTQGFLAGGVAAIQAVIDGRWEETLHLEFKTLSAASASNLAKDDRKILAKAICGLANAEGGTLVIGIRTKKEDCLDVATDRQPVLNYQRLRSQIAAALPEMLSPQHPGITVESVADDHDTSAGYVIIDVPTSDQRPHMSLKEHRYFRRGSDGTRVLEHAEVRELMFAVREGVLELEHIARTNGSTGDLTFQVSVVIVLRNTGRVPAVAPYVRATGEGWTMSWSMQGLGRRSSSRGGLTGIYSSRDVLVHPDDEIEIAEIETGLDFRQTGQIDIRHAIAVVEDNPASLLMVPFSKMNPQGYAIVDEPIACSGTFGAENSPAKPFEFRIDKMKLFALFREQHKL